MSPQYRITSALSLLQHDHDGATRGAIQVGARMPEEEGTLLRVLNWIALCVSPNSNTNTCVSISHDEPGRRLIFFLACDTSRHPDILCAASSLVQILWDAYIDHSRGANMITSDTRLRAFLAEHCWWRIHAKLSKISSLRDSEDIDVVAALRTHVESWEVWRLSHGMAGETSAALQARAKKLNLGSATDALKEILPSILSVDKDLPLEARPRQLKLIFFKCYAIVKSEFYRDYQQGKWTPVRDSFFLLKIFRKVWRIYFFQKSADYVIDRGLAYVNAEILPGAVDYEFSAQWIPESFASPLDRSITLDTEPKERLEGLGFTIIPRSDSSTHSASVFAHNQAWDPPHTQQLYIHPEIQMANFCSASEVVVVNQEIGLSRRPCYACRVYLKPQRLRDIAYKFTRSSEKSRADWMVPLEVPGALRAADLKRLVDTVTSDAEVKIGAIMLMASMVDSLGL